MIVTQSVHFRANDLQPCGDGVRLKHVESVFDWCKSVGVKNKHKAIILHEMQLKYIYLNTESLDIM